MTKLVPFFLFACFFFSPVIAKEKSAKTFQPFTGKVLGNKVRLRAKPDLDSYIIKQFSKNDLVLVLEDADEFWGVKPSNATKVYVYRSYILDNVVEANRVNVRLFANLEAPIVGQLQMGDKIQGKQYSKDHKWLEIQPSDNLRFYISKEFIAYGGDKNYFAAMQKRKKMVEELLEQAYTICQEEIKTPFAQMSPKNAIAPLEKIINDYPDFPDHVIRAKKQLVKLQESYLDKKIAYLEEQTNSVEEIADENLFPKIDTSDLEKVADKKPAFTRTSKKPTEKTLFWESTEQDLYENWATYNTKKSQQDFYQEQKANASLVTGTIEPYSQAIQNRPGDFVLKSEKKAPLGFLYSLHVDLSQFRGKEVTLLVSPRVNNHFARPAYYVLEVR